MTYGRELGSVVVGGEGLDLAGVVLATKMLEIAQEFGVDTFSERKKGIWGQIYENITVVSHSLDYDGWIAATKSLL